MSQYVKVKDNPGLVRDAFTKAVLNNDDSGLMAYKAAREKARKQEDALERINTLDTRINTMESRIEYLINLIESKK